MDRGKSLSGTRGTKSKISQPMPDSFIALGKPGTSRDDAKRPLPLTKTTVGSTGGAIEKLKREGSSSSLGVPPAKKLKVGLSGASRPTLGVSGSSFMSIDRTPSTSTGIEPWENFAIESDGLTLIDKVNYSIHGEQLDKLVGYILGLIKNLKGCKSKPCKIVYTQLFCIAAVRPHAFTTEHVVNAIFSILRKDVNVGLKGIHKTNTHVHQILIHLINYAYLDIENWPEVFVRFYVEDAIGDRIIIDNPFSKPFVENIITGFQTKIPPLSLLKSENWTSAARETSSPLTINADDDEAFSEQKQIVDLWLTKLMPRYYNCEERVEAIALEIVKETLARRQQPESISKNFVKFLTTACGSLEIRHIAASRIEAWLHNHKLMKPAQELLAYLCYNCAAHSQRDLEILNQISKLRLKNKPMITYFNNCLKEMVTASPENLYPLLKCTICNELGNSRNTNNLIVVGVLFQVKNEDAAVALADICLELLFSKDDCHRSLRALLKEINRVLRHDFNLPSVVQALLRERSDLLANCPDREARERIFLSLVDLATMCMLLCVSPQVRDAASQSKRDATVLETFKKQVASIQSGCVTWLHEYALKIYRPSISDFYHSLLKVLFLEQAEQYYKVDSWPGENERNLFLRLAGEVPLLQTTLTTILMLGMSKDFPVTPTEAIDISDQLIKRAANLPSDIEPPLFVDNVEIIELIFSLCSYNYPENITLPSGYVPPKLAISNLYWKAWLMLLILVAHNPVTLGNYVWTKYPTLRMFMEMCITNYFSFPPPTMINMEEDFQLKEQQTIAIEKQRILEFESYLAAASTKAEINEQTSLLLPQLMDLNAEGDPRRPPPQVLDVLQALNHAHRLGHLLCKSRNPDFLLDIMSRQGGTAHMPWLAELVHSSEGVLSHLPVQCLCEYLLSTAPTEKLTKHAQLLAHLRTAINNPDPLVAGEVLEYLFRRLTSDHAASRAQATKGLAMILAPTDDVELSPNNYINWLSQYISQFIHFPLIKSLLVQFLRQALQIETNPLIVSGYINFLSTQECYDTFGELNDLITDLSSVIIERHSVAFYVLPGENNVTLKNLMKIFYIYTVRAKENPEESYSIHQTYNNEYLIVQWDTGEQCAMQPLVIHAAIVLLTYGPLEDFTPFSGLLSIWFPSNMQRPRAYSPETSETTSYVPDWMKLRMIRSEVELLVEAAVDKLEPPKLVLFIQSFGIPTCSMSQLLNTLDKCTIVKRKAVMDAVLDKTYMVQLVEVQNKRGAVGGEIFVKAIEMLMHPLQETDAVIDIEVKKQLPPCVTQKPDATIFNDQIILENLNLLFNPHFDGDRNKIILNLIKWVNSKENMKIVLDFISSLPQHLILPPILQYRSFSKLFSIIFSGSLTEEKQLIANQVLSILPEGNCTKNVLRQYLKPRKVDEDTSLIDLVNNESLITGARTEKILNDPTNSLETIGKILLKSETEPEKTGLLVDWLSTLQLEIDNSAEQKIQIDLLFSKKPLHFRPLLMSHLLQRASWKTIQNLVSYLLDSKEIHEICPVSTLDFLTALTKSPKLWQGRDKAIPKHYHHEDVLNLSETEVKAVVKYILEEAQVPQTTNWKLKMESRLQLLLKCIGHYALPIVTDLYKNIDDNKYAKQLLIMIYMSLPFSGQYGIEFKPDMVQDISETNCSSAVDKISHCLLSALSATPRSKDWPRKSRDLELCSRKLTATHPLLVLRQLPMLAGSLKGRAQYDWSVLKSRGHYLLFGQVLGLMELLQPFIFHQTSTLRDLLESFFLLLQFHSQRPDLNTLVKRLVLLIQNWMLADIKGASKFLQDHANILNDIQFNQTAIRPLISSLSLPTSTASGAATTSTSEFLIATVNPPSPQPYPSHWQHLKSSLQSLDNLNAIQEIDHATTARPQLLGSVAQTLCGLIGSQNGAVRTIALSLIKRWLKFNPLAASDVLPAILSCLDSENGDIVNGILSHLHEFVPLMQEHAKVILTKVFELGTKSIAVTSNSINKTIDILSLQYGC